VSLVLILMPIVIVVHHDKPHGLPVQIAYEDKNCGDGRTIIARVLANGNVSFNGGVQEIQRSQLADRLKEIFRTMVERVLFIEADSSLPFRSVAEVIDISRRQVDLVAIRTPAVDARYCLSIHRQATGTTILPGDLPRL